MLHGGELTTERINPAKGNDELESIVNAVTGQPGDLLLCHRVSMGSAVESETGNSMSSKVTAKLRHKHYSEWKLTCIV